MMVVSLFCTGLLGFLQERTYGKYGPCWREGVFYTHFLSLPFFALLGRDIKQGLSSLSNPQSTTSTLTSFIILVGNLITQLMCVSGVNRLSSVRETIILYFILWNAHVHGVKSKCLQSRRTLR
ncbi:hypothetical protein BYT27DRAFT_6880417 [Phlegmacium glaucopus]|nr:hypothetical protein BYT27DRAFT_6880417 [Phlegmacium glaucopus]